MISRFRQNFLLNPHTLPDPSNLSFLPNRRDMCRCHQTYRNSGLLPLSEKKPPISLTEIGGLYVACSGYRLEFAGATQYILDFV